MALNTSNIYGRINVSDEAVSIVASKAAGECYGVVEMVSRGISDSLAQLFNRKSYGKGVRVMTIENTIYLDVFVVLKLGVAVNAVKESLISAIKYSVENFTGMRVKSVNVNIVGFRV